MAGNEKSMVSVEVPRALRDDVRALVEARSSWDALSLDGKFARVAHTINLPQRAATLLLLNDKPQSCIDLKNALEDASGMHIEAAHARFLEYGKNMFVPAGFAEVHEEDKGRGISRFSITEAGREVAVPLIISTFQYMQESGLGLPGILGGGGSVCDRDGPYRTAAVLAELANGQVERCVLEKRLGLATGEVAKRLEHVVLDIVQGDANCRFRLNPNYQGELPEIPYRKGLAKRVLDTLKDGASLTNPEIMQGVGLGGKDNRGNVSSVLTWYRNQGVVEKVEGRDVSYVLHEPFGVSLGRFVYGLRESLIDDRRLAAAQSVAGEIMRDPIRLQRLMRYALTRGEKYADEA